MMSGSSGQPNAAGLAPAALERNEEENPHGKQVTIYLPGFFYQLVTLEFISELLCFYY